MVRRESERLCVMANETNPLGILRGADEIAKAIGTTPRRVYYLAETGVLPATKEGSLWVTTLDKLRQFYEGGAQNGGAA